MTRRRDLRAPEGRSFASLDRDSGGRWWAMPLGQVIAEMVDAVRDRVEVSWHHETWHVTAGSFESALAYVDERFDDPVVLSRRDHGRRWTRVTLDVTEDPDRAPDAPPLAELAEPPAPPEPPAPSEPVAVCPASGRARGRSRASPGRTRSPTRDAPRPRGDLRPPEHPVLRNDTLRFRASRGLSTIVASSRPSPRTRRSWAAEHCWPTFAST